MSQRCSRSSWKKCRVAFRRPPSLPEQLVGDPLRLGQILTNLTNNAVDSPNGVSVIVVEELERARHHPVTLYGSGHRYWDSRGSCLNCSDLHPGRFIDYSEYGGTGLGLAICKRLVEMMGGAIRVRVPCTKGLHFLLS